MKRKVVSASIVLIILSSFCQANGIKPTAKFEKEVIKLLKNEIVARADKVLTESPQTITMFVCSRSAGGIHDFYSEGDYWWPDPANPDGPYIQRDGMTLSLIHI